MCATFNPTGMAMTFCNQFFEFLDSAPEGVKRSYYATAYSTKSDVQLYNVLEIYLASMRVRKEYNQCLDESIATTKEKFRAATVKMLGLKQISTFEYARSTLKIPDVYFSHQFAPVNPYPYMKWMKGGNIDNKVVNIVKNKGDGEYSIKLKEKYLYHKVKKKNICLYELTGLYDYCKNNIYNEKRKQNMKKNNRGRKQNKVLEIDIDSPNIGFYRKRSYPVVPYLVGNTPPSDEKKYLLYLVLLEELEKLKELRLKFSELDSKSENFWKDAFFKSKADFQEWKLRIIDNFEELFLAKKLARMDGYVRSKFNAEDIRRVKEKCKQTESFGSEESDREYQSLSYNNMLSGERISSSNISKKAIFMQAGFKNTKKRYMSQSNSPTNMENCLGVSTKYSQMDRWKSIGKPKWTPYEFGTKRKKSTCSEKHYRYLNKPIFTEIGASKASLRKKSKISKPTDVCNWKKLSTKPTIEETVKFFSLNHCQTRATVPILHHMLNILTKTGHEKLDKPFTAKIQAGPGCGKSHIIQCILWFLYQYNAEDQVFLI